MKNPSIMVFGDSNTYGYNPSTGGRYPVSWTDILQQKSRLHLINRGILGREVPPGAFALNSALNEIGHAADSLWIMLGTNDLLNGSASEAVGRRMDSLLSAIQITYPELKLLLIAPVKLQQGTWVSSDRVILESSNLASVYQTLAERHGISFVSAENWPIPLMFDGVHFTEAGHLLFADKILAEPGFPFI